MIRSATILSIEPHVLRLRREFDRADIHGDSIRRIAATHEAECLLALMNDIKRAITAPSNNVSEVA